MEQLPTTGPPAPATMEIAGGTHTSWELVRMGEEKFKIVKVDFVKFRLARQGSSVGN